MFFRNFSVFDNVLILLVTSSLLFFFGFVFIKVLTSEEKTVEDQIVNVNFLIHKLITTVLFYL